MSGFAIRVLGVALIAAALIPWTAQSAATPVTIWGTWQREPADSEDLDRKLAPLVETQRQRALSHSGWGGGRRGRTEDLDAPEMPVEAAEKIRDRLADELRPPASLHIALVDGAVEIAGNSAPVRRFQPGQNISRIDASGTASVSSSWDHRAFIIRARYLNGGSRLWRYEVEPASGLLRLTFEGGDAEFGRLTLQTRYRRVP